MLVFAAITPHPPLLLPTIGREQEDKLKKTLESFQSLHRLFKESDPETIIFLSPHSTQIKDALSINLHETYVGDLSAFGDIATKPKFWPDRQLTEYLKRALRKKYLPTTLVSSHVIDHGISVPAVLLEAQEKKIIPINIASGLDFKTHFNIGETIKDALINSNQRIAVVASSDLSHRHLSDSPAGFSAKAALFDNLLIEAIETKNSTRLLTVLPDIISEAAPCGFLCILIILGLLSEINYTPHVLSYEHPFGVGYLTANFELYHA